MDIRNRIRQNQQKNVKNMPHFMVERLDKFRYAEDTENTLRLAINDKSDTERLGSEIGKAIVNLKNENIAISGIYVYGKFKVGKSTLIKNIVNNLEHDENIEEIDVKRMTRFQKYTMVNPNVIHIDYFNDRYTGKEVKKVELAENEILIAEWSETLSDFEENRIEIELMELDTNETITDKKECLIYKTTQDKTVYASIIGYNNGLEIIKKLKEIYNGQ